MEQIDPVFQEIQELEETAKSVAEIQEQLDLIIKAADLCVRYGQEWLDPLGRKELSKKLQRLISLGERLKKSNNDHGANIFQMDALEDSLIQQNLLGEPGRSRRNLSKKEQILILKASRFRGNKFPPWTRNPGSQDFDGSSQSVIPEDGLGDLTLSKEHLEHFREWNRAEKAMPPPSLAGEHGDFPTMIPEKPLDLIQDVGADCSVVASICAVMTKLDIGQKLSILQTHHHQS
jgi:hypothetical protein